MKKLLLLPIAIFALVSCESSDTSPETAHIYAIGNNGSYEAYITKDGVSSSLGTEYFVTDLFVDGNDVYTCGQKNIKAAYSKNGVFTVLGSTTTSYANSIFVKNNDVYVIGKNDNNLPVYWKNGVENILATSPEYLGWAYDITITNNNDVYIGGYQYQFGNPIIKILYWKNGELTVINSTHRYSGSWLGEISIAVDNEDVYLAVNERNDTGVFNSNAYLIKNGTEETLIDDNSEVHDIFISNSDIYLCGDHIEPSGIPNKSIIWKNGTVVVEKDVEHGAFLSLFVSNNNIFAGGIDSSLVSGAFQNHATTLINNVFEVSPDFGTSVGGSGYMSIFVTE